MRGMKINSEFWLEVSKERDNLEDLDVEGRTIISSA
jgi:hypothetical protein